MEVWTSAGSGERRRFELISMLFGGRKDLLSWLFDKESARLRLPTELLIKNSAGFSSGDRVLVKIAVDIWCDQGGALISELQALDSHLLARVLKVLELSYV